MLSQRTGARLAAVPPSAAQERRESAPWAHSRRRRRCAPSCAAGPLPAAEARREPRAAHPRCLRQTTRRTPHPRLLWTSVSVELCSQPPLPCPSSVPVGRHTFRQPPPCRSCGGRLRTGPLRRSAAHVDHLGTTERSHKGNAHTCRALLLLFWTRFSAHVSVHTRLIQPCNSLTTNVQVAGRRESNSQNSATSGSQQL